MKTKFDKIFDEAIQNINSDEEKNSQSATDEKKEKQRLRMIASKGIYKIVYNMELSDIRRFFKEYLMTAEHDTDLLKRMVVDIVNDRMFTMSLDELKEFLSDNEIKTEEESGKKTYAFTPESIVKLLKK